MPDFEKFKKREVILAVVQIVIAMLISLNCAYIFSYRWNYQDLYSIREQVWFHHHPLINKYLYWNNWITHICHHSKRVQRYDPGPRSTAYKQTWLYTAYPSLATIPLLISNALVLIHRYKQLLKSSFNWSKTFTIYFHTTGIHILLSLVLWLEHSALECSSPPPTWSSPAAPWPSSSASPCSTSSPASSSCCLSPSAATIPRLPRETSGSCLRVFLQVLNSFSRGWARNQKTGKSWREIQGKQE